MRAGQIQPLEVWEKRIEHSWTEEHLMKVFGHTFLWPTPTSKDGPSGPGTSPKREGGLNLRTAVTLWPTPTHRDWKSGNSNLMTKNSRPLSEVVVGGKGGTLNPRWVEWLQGFPDNYTEVGE